MDDTPARAEYLQRLSTWRVAVTDGERAESRLSNGRLVVFFVGTAVTWWAVSADAAPLLWLAAFLAGFVVLVIAHGRVQSGLSRAQRAAAFHERNVDRVEGRWIGVGVEAPMRREQRHPYAEDLDLFGRGSLFQLLCSSRTHLGEDTLGGWLCEPVGAERVADRQRAVAELREDVDLREALALLGDDLVEGFDPEALAAWATAPAAPVPVPERVLAGVLGLAGVGGVVAWAAGFGLGPLGIVVLVQMAASKIRPQPSWKRTDETHEACRALSLLAELLELVESRRFAAPALVRLVDALRTEGVPASARVAWLDRAVGMVLDAERNPYWAVGAFVLQLRPFLVHRVELWRGAIGPSVPQWLEAAGALEAFCSVAAHAHENPDYVVPEIHADGPCLELEGVGHPLIPRDRCVRNSLSLDPGLALILLSGSNMSGKSTLLRSAGVAVVLAMCGAPVCARRARLSPFRIGASLHVVDSLQEGTSHFYAEIARLADVDALLDGDLPVLFLLDEILHGTNSHDRMVGASAVVKRLIERGAVGLVTTHDLSLTRIADDLGPRARNAHFEDGLEDGRMTFDYLLREGVVGRGNALGLMRSLGLPV